MVFNHQLNVRLVIAVKKWIWITVSLFIVILGLLAAYYHSIRSDLSQMQEEAVKKAKEAVDLTKIDKVNYYYGNKAYQVIEATDHKKKKVIVFVPEKNGEIISTEASKGITKKEAMDKVKKERQVDEFIDVRLGIEKKTPIWEIVYVDQQGSYNYHYLRFSSGDLYKRYSISSR